MPKNFPLPGTYRFDGDKATRVEPYIFSENIVIALDVALATQRPLLVAGRPGCGKSRLADAMATILKWNFLSKTMTSRTRLEELTVEVDHLRRLHDAQRGRDADTLKPDAAYQNPGIFWWAFDPDSARRRGCTRELANTHGIEVGFPGVRRIRDNAAQHAVLLIDEIDKAEPDVPNDLLEPLDQRSFGLPDGSKLRADDQQQLLTIITTNGERALPPAFLRRCVSLLLDDPDKDELVAIAQVHYPKADVARITAIADKILKFRTDAPSAGRRAPGTSEFLDAIVACEELGIDVDEAERSTWWHIEGAILQKTTQG
jgi:MoxR-like ATPase